MGGGTRIDDHNERKEISISSLKWTKIAVGLVVCTLIISIISLAISISN